MFALIALSTSALFAPHEEKAFLTWMRDSNNFYSGEEYQFRFGIWISNFRRVQEHNAGNSLFKVEMNELSHLTTTEYRSMLGIRVSRQPTNKVTRPSRLNGAVDWRKQGVVNPIKDQGQCGSCWAFSADQAIESIWAIKSGTLYNLAESNLVDCVKTCYGCDGGLMDESYVWIVRYQGGKSMLTSDYPYRPVQTTCKWDANKGVTKITGYNEIREEDEADLVDKIEHVGPVAVAIDAGQWTFQMYRAGIYDDPKCSSYDLNHGVGAIGFGTEGAKEYYIVRNSWGVVWGEQGYMRMLKLNNLCGIATMSCYPLI
jgi:cathepsin L